MSLFSGESSAGSSQTDPSLLAVFYDYIKLMPMVTEANQMSQELNKVTHSHMLQIFKSTVFSVVFIKLKDGDYLLSMLVL